MASLAVVKAVQSARFTQTRLLVQMGSDVNGKDADGKTPLIHALLLQEPRARASFLRLLLKAGATVSQPDRKRRNALMWACSVSSIEEVRLLLRHSDVDLDLNAKNVLGQTALWIAVDGDKVETVKELLQALSKYDLNTEVADHYGVTPAMRAAVLGHLDCLRALIAHLDTVTKSSNARMTIAKINHLLESMSVMNKQKTVSLVPRPQNPETKTPSTVKLPTIQVISSDNFQPGNSECPQTEQGSNYTLFSLQFHRDPTRCSTPVSVTDSVLSNSPDPQGSRLESPIPADSDNPDSNSLHEGSGTERALTPSKRRTPVKKKKSSVKSEDQARILKEHKRSVGSKSPTPVRKKSTAAKTDDQAHMLKEQKRSTASISPTPLGKKNSKVKFENQEHSLNDCKNYVPIPPIPVWKRGTTVAPETQEQTSNEHQSPESNSPTLLKKSTTVNPEDQDHTPNEHACFAAISSTPLKVTSTTVKSEDREPTMAERQSSVLSSSPATPRKISSKGQSEDHIPSLNEGKQLAVSVPPAPWKKTTASVTTLQDHGPMRNDHRLSASTRPNTVPAGDSPMSGPRVRRPGRIVLQPLARVTIVRGSIRDSLPGLFEVIAQQKSPSFRKAAIKPKIKPTVLIPQVAVSPALPKSPRLKLKGSKWTKLRGVAMLGGLAKAARKPAAGGKLSPKPKPRQRKLTPAAQPRLEGASP